MYRGKELIRNKGRSLVLPILLSAVFLMTGIAAGSFTLKAVDMNTKQDMMSYIYGFFGTNSGREFNQQSIFMEAIKNDLIYIIPVYFLGMTVIGIPAALFMLIFRGFEIGFTVSLFMAGLGIKGALLTLISVVPQNIIYIPAIITVSAAVYCYNMGTIKERHSTKTGSKIMIYTSVIGAALIVLVLGSFVEAYLTPILMKAAASYIIVQ